MLLADTQLSAPVRRTQPAVSAAPEPPAQWHRVLTVLADVSLLIGTRNVWTQAATHRISLALVISVCYASVLGCGVLALTVRSRRSLARVDLCVLVTGLILAACTAVLFHRGSDEAALTTQAARELVAGHGIYGHAWPWLFGRDGVAVTPTVTGGYDYTYGYPPLAPLLTAPLLWLGHGAVPAIAVSMGALLAGTVVLWWLLPTPWRSAATMVCLGFSFLPMYGRLGYPAVLALALLVPVVVRWPRIGRGGRLGPAGLAQGACLGAACAAQQLPWFVAPFLLAGLYSLRRGELGARAAAGLLLRFAGAAAVVWLLINTYFLVSRPGAWLEGIALPIIQGAVLHGQGLVDVSLYLTNGSDRIDWYSHASILLLAGLLGLFVLFIRRLGPAATVLPWCAFWLATRSQDGYYLMMTPLWLAGAVTAPHSEFVRAWQPRPRLLSGPRRRPARAAAAGLLLVPALASAVLAATGSPPLDLRVTALKAGERTLTRLTLRVTNHDDEALTPHFTLTKGQGMYPYFSVLRGPATLPAHTTAVYELRPPGGSYALPHRHQRVRLRVFTASPQTLSSAYVTLPTA
ncbi:hypothetical protein ABZ896_13710 [Streptomyces sp. NPDC047072]|uniref:hypothetical protein n=1 Tax=Streptomyces sp. NPDC047072 TaxID=3154809 RepID=UPI00340FFC0A